MKKVAICSIDAQGHTDPALSLVKALVHDGCQVDYVSPASSNDAFRSVGAKVFQTRSTLNQFRTKDPVSGEIGGYKSFVNKQSAMDAFTSRVRSKFVQDAVLSLDFMIDYCERNSPDVVVADRMSLSGLLAAKRIGIPAVSLHPFYCGNHIVPGVQPIFETPTDEGVYSKLVEQKDELRKISLSCPDTVEGLLADHDGLNIVLCSREFHPSGEAFGDNYHFVGPLFSNISLMDNPTKDTIYISFGTLYGIGLEPLYRQCIEAVVELGYRVVVAIGGLNSVDDFEGLPSNVLIQNFVDQEEVLSRSVIFINHGGVNSAQQAICMKVPMICFPQAFEQFTTARQVAKLGCGANLNGSIDTVVDVRDAVRMLTSSRVVRDVLESQSRYARNAGGLIKTIQLINDQ